MNQQTNDGDTRIRPASPADVPAIVEIYNEAVRNTTATFDTEPQSLETRLKWFGSHGPEHPVAVAVQEDLVVGWGSLSRWSERRAYRQTVEISFYVSESHQGQGFGRGLLLWLVKAATKLGHHTIIARVAEESEASRRLCQSAGFETVGVLRQVGCKFGRRLDVEILQMMLGTRANA